ncbi:MAG: ArsB/NhaD family transporter [Nitrospirota bacterium]
MITLPIFLATVYLSMAQPAVGSLRITPSRAALLGAAAMLLLFPSSPWPLVHSSVLILWRPLLTITGLMIVTLVARRAGLFDRLVGAVVRASGGDGRRLFAWLFVTGVLTGSIFTNDAAVLILTPMVCLLCRRSPGLQPAPYLFAVLNVANLVAALVISNPINLVVADYIGIPFVEYAAWMALPAAVAAASTYAVLRFYFRREIAASRLEPPPEPNAPRSPLLVPSLAVIGLIVPAAFLGPLIGLPLWLIMAGGAAVLLLLARRLAGIAPQAVVRDVAWDVLIFVAGIFIIVNGLRETGLAGMLAELMARLGGRELPSMIVSTGVVAAVSSALMNNHPTAYLMAMSLDHLTAVPAEQRVLAFAMLIGGDLGPKLLPIGSLAALLWFRILKDHGIQMPYGRYIRVGVPVTLVALLLALAVLAGEAAVVRLLAG